MARKFKLNVGVDFIKIEFLARKFNLNVRAYFIKIEVLARKFKLKVGADFIKIEFLARKFKVNVGADFIKIEFLNTKIWILPQCGNMICYLESFNEHWHVSSLIQTLVSPFQKHSRSLLKIPRRSFSPRRSKIYRPSNSIISSVSSTSGISQNQDQNQARNGQVRFHDFCFEGRVAKNPASTFVV